MNEKMNPLENRDYVPGKETILNDWDKEVLLKGGRGVIKKLLEEFNDTLPDAIIYPETSARPLFYLFNPVFNKISEKHNCPKPKVFFFNVSKPDSPTSFDFDWDDTENPLQYIQQKIQDLRKESAGGEDDIFHSEEEKESYILGLENDEEDIKRLLPKRSVEKVRAEEIKNYINKLGLDVSKIVVIDEFLHKGTTQSEINHAFGKDINFKSIFSDEYSDDAGFNKPEDHPDNPSTNSDSKFTYSGTWNGDYKNSIGVVKSKGDKYATPLRKFDGFTEEDQLDIKLLRTEMNDLGEQLANDI